MQFIRPYPDYPEKSAIRKLVKMARITMNHIIRHLRLKLNDSVPIALASDEYYFGDTVKISNEYRNLAGVLTTPTAPTITITDPNGTVTVNADTPTEESTGVFFFNYEPTEVEGYWQFVFGGSVESLETSWPLRQFRVLPDGARFTWTDNELQTFLDLHRRRINRKRLDVDEDWQVFEGRFTMLEGSTVTWSGTGDPEDVINIWDRSGRDATFKAPTSYNLVSGTFRFDSQQNEQPYYLDAYSYSINGAIAEAYEQLASDTARAKSWSRGGVSYTYDSFLDMAKRFKGLSGTDKGRLV